VIPDSWLPALIVGAPAAAGVFTFLLGEARHRLRVALNLGGAGLALALVLVLLWGVFHQHAYEARLALLPGIDLVLRADALSVFFSLLSAVLWFLTTVYALGYLEGAPNRSRFFGFFSLCVSATLGVALAGNLVTFLFAYEILTLCTYPLVAHRGSEEARRAARTYLAYTLGGGAALLLGVVWLYGLVGPRDFTETGYLSAYAADHGPALGVIFALLMAGLGVKAALVPLHGWLPKAMVAPAPVSALLHAVAVVKSGVFGIVRVIYDVYGVELAHQMGLTAPLAAVAALTIIYGSVRALYQDDLKRRLAYSTVSQVSYITLGVATVGPLATVGGVVHLVHQGVMKITLFFCAGIIAETLGIHRISELQGVGRRLPGTLAAFTVAALGMIGVPPLAGFFSKWYLGLGGLAAGEPWLVVVLMTSSLLNAAYFLPILYAAWFEPGRASWPRERRPGALEAHWMLLLPTLATAALVLAVGFFAGAHFSPLGWAKLIAAREYGG
jgi:multicomponent Na+:H+ antiporter subunit D